VLLDNFYVNSDVSADGTTGPPPPSRPTYVQKMWPNSYAPAAAGGYDYEGQEPTAKRRRRLPLDQRRGAANLHAHYGYFVNNIAPRPQARAASRSQVSATPY